MSNNNYIDFNKKTGFICDMDGVIYHGNHILPGVAEFINWLHEEKKEYLFLTYLLYIRSVKKKSLSFCIVSCLWSHTMGRPIFSQKGSLQWIPFL